MHLRITAAGLEIWAPAKINLFLEVLAKRGDGFHEIETLMCPVTLFDTLIAERNASDQIDFVCSRARAAQEQAAPETDNVPEGTENTVVRAVRLLAQRSGTALGLRLHLIKRIPVAAGLAGGSSDAAAALIVANRLWKSGLSTAELADLAAEIGSDVPFFLGRGSAICRGRGEQITPLAGMGVWHFVIVRPPAGLSTAEVYRACRPANRPVLVQPLVDALCQRQVGKIALRLHNRLQAPAGAICEWIDRLQAEFDRCDCVGHQMSGSGTSYFGVCRSARHARRIAGALSARGVGRVYAVANCP